MCEPAPSLGRSLDALRLLRTTFQLLIATQVRQVLTTGQRQPPPGELEDDWTAVDLTPACSPLSPALPWRSNT